MRTTSRREFLSSSSRLATFGVIAQKALPCVAGQLDSRSLRLCFTVKGIQVFGIGRGIPVVLLHELNGLSPGCLDLGRRLADEDFAVYLPLMFGHLGQDQIFFGSLEACLFGSFSCFRVGTAGRELAYIQQICDQVAQISEAQRIGVVGMCLSGALPLGVMRNPKVKAVVLSQPALPFGFTKHAHAAVGVNDADLEAARASGTPVLAFRFKADCLSRHERIETIEHKLAPDQLKLHEFDSPHALQPKSHRLHAVLTAGIEPAASEAFTEMVEFLKANLA